MATTIASLEAKLELQARQFNAQLKQVESRLETDRLYGVPDGDVRSGLVGEWRFDKPGDTLLDYSGYGANAAIEIADWITTKYGFALYENVTDFDQIDCHGIDRCRLQQRLGPCQTWWPPRFWVDKLD